MTTRIQKVDLETGAESIGLVSSSELTPDVFDGVLTNYNLRKELHHKLLENSEYVIYQHQQGSVDNTFYTNMPPSPLPTYSIDDDDYYYEFSTTGQWNRRAVNNSDNQDKSTLYLHFLCNQNGEVNYWSQFKTVQCNWIAGDYINLTTEPFIIFPAQLGTGFEYVNVVVSTQPFYSPIEYPVYPTGDYSNTYLEFRVRRVLKTSWKKLFPFHCRWTLENDDMITIPDIDGASLPFEGYYHIDYHFDFATAMCFAEGEPDVYPIANMVEISSTGGDNLRTFAEYLYPSKSLEGSGIIYCAPNNGYNAINIMIIYENDGRTHNLLYGYVHLHYLNQQPEGILLTP